MSRDGLTDGGVRDDWTDNDICRSVYSYTDGVIMSGASVGADCDIESQSVMITGSETFAPAHSRHLQLLTYYFISGFGNY